MPIPKLVLPESKHIPRFEAEDIRETVKAVLERLSPLPVKEIKSSVETLQQGFSIEFPGPLRGLITVQTSSELIRDVVYAVFPQAGPSPSDKDCFEEFKVLLADRLMLHLWGHHSAWFSDNIPVFTRSARREFKPTGQWTFTIQDRALEVYVWFDREGK